MSLCRRRVTVPGALLLGLTLLFGWLAVPARADVDMELVVESITEQGYYVDSQALYMKSDESVEALRSGVESFGPVFVAVLPPGESAATRLRQMSQQMGRKATYVVLAGNQLRASSTSLPASRIKTAYSKATAANKGQPENALIAFMRNLPLEKGAPAPPKQQPSTTPKITPKARKSGTAESGGAGSENVPAASKEKAEEGGAPIGLIVAAVAVIAVLGAGGVFFWRRRQHPPAQPGPLYQEAGQPAQRPQAPQESQGSEPPPGAPRY